MPDPIRILFLADTHLGFDLPVQPRIHRRRRGHDFLANYATALEPALRGEVDVVVHGGDVFQRSHPHASVAYQAFEPLVRVADRGIPVFVVPGNHERGRLPHLRFARHSGIHVFELPETFVVSVRGVRLAVAGFPSERDDVRRRFPLLVESTGWAAVDADLRLLCMHQCVEGATVGPGDYTFRNAADVVRGRDIHPGFAAVLSGHIHRHQVLSSDLSGRALATPVLYPGAIERTSIAEANETKGFLWVHVQPNTPVWWHFEPLPSRPLLVRDLHVDGLPAHLVEDALCELIAGTPGDAVLTIRVFGRLGPAAVRVLRAANVRRLAPETMNIDLRFPEARRRTDAGPPDARFDALELLF